MKTFTPLGSVAILTAVLVGLVAGCNGSSSIPNLTQAAVALPGKAVYVGPRLNQARYSHTATPLEDGSVLIVGGTDERHFTALDTVEIFDQSARVELSLPIPESISGDFIDQDIDGNLIALSNGGRFFHTADPIDDGNVLIIGGTTSILFGIANEDSEIFDPLTRSFSNPDLLIDPDDDIEFPRVRHATQQLPNGKLLISGGQESLTIVIPGGGAFGGTLTQPAYPTTEKLEIFDPAALEFVTAIDTNGDEVELTTPRGRGGHATATWSGFDNLIGTGDDVVGFVGGIQTLSAESLLAPQDMTAWNADATQLTSMDFFFTSTGAVSFAQGVVLPARMNGVLALNLGRFRQATPFGNFGVSNAVLVTGGDNDQAGCPEGPVPQSGENVDFSDLLIATYTGFGPANGARFTRFTDFAGVLGLEVSGFCMSVHNRSESDAVIMDMSRTIDGQPFIGSVIVIGGGSDQTIPPPGGCIQTINGSCAGRTEGFEFYDPFYDWQNAMDFDGDGELDVFPWQFEDNGTPLNPLGLRGSFLTYDASIPTGQDLVGLADFADADEAQTVTLNQGRAFHTLTRIPGEDGLLGNLDDRVVVIGGSEEYHPLFGDDVVSNSCEIFLPPDAGVVAAP